jgi:hypothetical protein
MAMGESCHASQIRGDWTVHELLAFNISIRKMNDPSLVILSQPMPAPLASSNMSTLFRALKSYHFH